MFREYKYEKPKIELNLTGSSATAAFAGGGWLLFDITESSNNKESPVPI